MYEKIEFAEKKGRGLSSKLIMPVLLIFTVTLIILVYLANHRHYTVILPVDQSLSTNDKSQGEGTANDEVDLAPHVDIIVPNFDHLSNNVDDINDVTADPAETISVSSDTYNPSSKTDQETITSINPSSKTDQETITSINPSSKTDQETITSINPSSKTDQETITSINPSSKTDQETITSINPSSKTDQETITSINHSSKTDQETIPDNDTYETYNTLSQSNPDTFSSSTPWDVDGESPGDDQSFFQKLFNWNWRNPEDDKRIPDGNTDGIDPTEKINSTADLVNNTTWSDSLDLYSTDIFNSTETINSSATFNTTFQDSSPLVNSLNNLGPTKNTLPDEIVSSTPPVPAVMTSLPPCFNLSSSNLKDIITNALRIASGSQRESMKDFERVLKLNSDLGVIDARGGLSVYTLIAVGMERKVVVLEPNHECAEQLRQVIGMNGLLDLVTIKELSLLHKSGKGTFMSLEGEYFVSSADDSDIKTNNSVEQLLVNTITLNDLAIGLPFEKAVLCLDVESFQPSIFNSATSFFETVKVNYVFMTWAYDKDNDQSAADTISFLGKQNFEPRERLQNGFGLIPNFYRYWPENVVWVNKQPWLNIN